MLSLEEAQRRVLAPLQPLGVEEVSLANATDRFLACAVVARTALPPFDNSAMDGYAVRALDVAGASAQQPVRLRVADRIPAGECGATAVEPGHCVRVFTGSPLPPGADAVVMQEDTCLDPDDAAWVLILDAARPWENIRFRGEDVAIESTVATSGARMTAGSIGLLGATGVSTIAVHRRPLVALLATGNELVEPHPGMDLRRGQIFESNRAMLAALVGAGGALPRVYPIVRDSLEGTMRALETAAAECDVIVSSGGVSVGEFDFVKEAVQRLGGTLDFWRVAIKPGKPFVAAECRGKPFYGLPGNPVSAFVTFLLLVRPALRKLGGANEIHLPIVHGRLQETLCNPGDRRHFVRVSMDAGRNVRLSGTQASHRLFSLSMANGLVDLAPGIMLTAGTEVPVLKWD